MSCDLLKKIIILFMFLRNGRPDCMCVSKDGSASCDNFSINSIDTRNKEKTEKVASIYVTNNCTLSGNALSFDNITNLRLSCNIKKLQFDAFANQRHIRSLDLSENNISNLPNDFFVSIPFLENLNLSHNIFENPTLDTFYSLDNIKILDLSYNTISNLELGILDEMKKLEELYLNGNKMAVIELGLFDLSRNLRKLDLSSNHLHELVLGLFDQSQSLITVDLSKNFFVGEVPLGTYDNFINTTTLNLKDCQIQKLPLGVFDETVKLIQLGLSENKLTELAKGIFDRIIHLKFLNLAGNKLEVLPDNLFDQNSQLQDLDVSRNRLKTLPELIFRKSENFRNLNLSRNRIDRLPIDIFQWTALTSIDISYNKFVTIEPNLLNMETLERVYAQNNHISYLDELTFSTINFPLRYLDISNNRLVFIGKYFFDWVENLEQMEVFGNPWDCACLDDLIDVMTKKFITYTADGYYEGKVPICVSLRPYLNKCNFDTNNKKDLDQYYNLYTHRH